MGISQSTYSRIESGELAPDVRLLIGLQVVLGLSLRRMVPVSYHEIEEQVMARATGLDAMWAKSSRSVARHKRRLLSAMAKRAKGSAPAA